MNKHLIFVFFIIIAFILAVSCTNPMSTPPADTESSTAEEEDNGGLFVDEEAGVVAGLNFDENIDEDSEVIIEGAVWSQGIAGSALEFNGYDQYVIVPDSESLTLASQGTLEAWIYPYTHRPFAGVLHKGEKKDFSDESWSLQFWGKKGQLALLLYNSEGKRINVKSTFKLNTEEWYHIAASWDSEYVRLYINGEENISKSNSIGEIRDSDGRLIIGARLSELFNQLYGYVGFNGIIDEVNVYNRVLSAAEISEHFNALDPN